MPHAMLREYLRSGRMHTRLAEPAQPLRARAPLSAAMRVLGEWPDPPEQPEGV
ncbi:MAG: hypothetical protein LC700_00825 [Actinobacteria bacterium]|nr:hypothetical protein [Actinomycetota bacterium]